MKKYPAHTIIHNFFVQCKTVIEKQTADEDALPKRSYFEQQQKQKKKKTKSPHKNLSQKAKMRKIYNLYSNTDISVSRICRVYIVDTYTSVYRCVVWKKRVQHIMQSNNKKFLLSFNSQYMGERFTKYKVHIHLDDMMGPGDLVSKRVDRRAGELIFSYKIL